MARTPSPAATNPPTGETTPDTPAELYFLWYDLTDAFAVQFVSVATIAPGASSALRTALPTNTAVRLAGGTLDLNGKQALISSLEVVPNADAALTGATSGVLPASIAVAGDVQALRGRSLRLLSVPDGFPDGVPAVTSNDDDPHWTPVYRNGVLRLMWAGGTVILFR